MPNEYPPSRVVFCEDEILAAQQGLADILRRGVLTAGPLTASLESLLASFHRRHGAVATSSGTSALQSIFTAMNLQDQHILIPSNTNYATARAAIDAGARVELYDGGLYPDRPDILSRITPDTRAIVVVHIGGYVGGVSAQLRHDCTARSILLVEDVAHAHGALSAQGELAGTLGDAAAFSFYQSKVVTSGEGGAVVADNHTLLDDVRLLRSQGLPRHSDVHVLPGNTWRMTEIEALLVTLQLSRLEVDCARRHAAIQRYMTNLSESRVMTFPDEIGERLSGYKAVGLVDPHRREAFRGESLTLGVRLDREIYSRPLHRQPLFRSCAQGSYRAADTFADGHICLPMWRNISQAEIDEISDRLLTAEARID